jgi:uncharacterized membrane protein
MTIDEWLERRDPRPPAQLMESLRSAVGPALSKDASETAAVFLATAEQKLRELVTSGENGRPVAGDLLTIDALTTYALESAAETLRSLGGFSDEAMARLAKTAPPQDPSATDA